VQVLHPSSAQMTSVSKRLGGLRCFRFFDPSTKDRSDGTEVFLPSLLCLENLEEKMFYDE
jgi:hypothetical protein